MIRPIALAAVLALLGAGCASPKKNTAAPPPGPSAAEREKNLREAIDLASQAESAQRAGKWEDSIRLNQEALQRNDQLGAAWHNLGVGYFQTQENMKAQQCFMRAADLLPLDPKPYENLGLLYMNNLHHADALKYYEMALERDPLWLPALRGAVLAAKNMSVSTRAGLERAKRGQLLEQEPGWRKVFDAEYLRVSQDLAEEEKRLRKPA